MDSGCCGSGVAEHGQLVRVVLEESRSQVGRAAHGHDHGHRDLDRSQCTILLREKGETERWQPVSPTLMRHLLAHFDERGDGNPKSQLLRYAKGKPITKRRYDYIFGRVQNELDWARALQVS